MNIINEQIWSDFANNLKSDQSRKEYRHAIEEITEYLGKPFLEITALDSQAYFNQLQTKNMKRSTILVRQAKLRSFQIFF
jgi:antitoxin component HigA of HigAB toxin-antitoxin module